MSSALSSTIPVGMRVSPIVESLERVRMTAMMSRGDWLDLIGLGWAEYQKLETGLPSTSANTYGVLESVAGHFGLDPENLIDGKIDFTRLALTHEPDVALPETYLTGAFGRRRTTINAINVIEQIAGWRLRLDIKRKFGLTEAHLHDPFAPISIRLITEMCEYLRRRSFGKTDFFAIGADSNMANRDSIVGQILSAARTTPEVYELFFNECMSLLERNCTYTIVESRPDGLVFEVRSNADAAEALGVRELGSQTLCQLKAGLTASVPLFIKQPMAYIEHTTCVHRGDEVCRFEIVYRHLPLIV